MDCRDKPGNDTAFGEKASHTMIAVGWDIGGANLKLAIVEDGAVVRVHQIPCPAIQDRLKFDRALESAMAFVPKGARHAVTMTGELSDVFASRAEGVAYLVQLINSQRVADAVAIYAGPAGFVPAEQAPAGWRDIASANWHATATLVGRLSRDALLVDIGTTTTDLIPIRAGACAAQGFTDAERLATGELIYTGVVRTPVMAVARRAPFAGVAQGLAAERFATMADVYRLTGDLPDGADDHPTADGAGKSLEENAARLARMTGRDLADAPMREWIALAKVLADRQLDEIATTASGLIHETVIGAGCGRFLAEQLARRCSHPYADFCNLIDVTDEAREMAATCAPAVSVGLLLDDDRSRRV